MSGLPLRYLNTCRNLAVVFVRVFDTCREGVECCVAVTAQSCHKEEDRCNRAVEDLRLLFGKGAAGVVVSDGEDVVARWYSCGRA